jgi:hypothetical protein
MRGLGIMSHSAIRVHSHVAFRTGKSTVEYVPNLGITAQLLDSSYPASLLDPIPTKASNTFQ